jgi:hypothetical protein
MKRLSFIAALIVCVASSFAAIGGAQTVIPSGCYNVSTNATSATFYAMVCPTPPPTPAPTPTPAATPSIAQGVGSVPSSEGSSCIVTWPSAPPAGHIIELAGYIASGRTYTTPTGYTLLDSDVVSGALSLYTWYKVAGSSEPTAVTLTASGSDGISCGGVDVGNVSAILSHAIASISGTTMPNASVTTSATGAYLPVAFFVANTAAGVTAHATGWTEIFSGYASSVNGNGFNYPYNALEFQSGPYQSASSATASATWNVTSGNGPISIGQITLFVPLANAPSPAPSGSTSPSPSPSPAPSGTPMTISGPVTNLDSANGGFDTCPATPIFSGYGCTPVNVTNATVSGTLAVGSTFTATGYGVPPLFTATSIVYTAAPTPAPTGTGTYLGMANAADYPTTFTPYASTSIWRQPLSSSPTVLANNSAILAIQFPGGVNNAVIRANEAGVYDYNHPRYFATSSDPVVSWSCTLYCGATDNGGMPATFHVPAWARPAGGGDSHFDIVQPDGTEITMWGAAKPSSNYVNGSIISTANISNCGNFSTGAGEIYNGPGPTAMQACDDAGILTAAELINGTVNHALFLVNNSAMPSAFSPPGVNSQFPASAGSNTQYSASGHAAAPLGGRMKATVSNATIQAVTTCTSSNASTDDQPGGCYWPWEKAILGDLAVFGAYMGDSGACITSNLTDDATGFCPRVESEEPWYLANGQGYTSPFAPLASQGWQSQTITNVNGSNSGTRWYFPNGWNPWPTVGKTWLTGVEWLAPCATQGAC